MSGKMAIYEARALKYQREAHKAQVKLDEYMGEFDDDEEEEEPIRKRPTTMGLRKDLEKQRQEEADLAQQYPLTQLLAQEIENDKESWLERENKHLEDKLDKEKKYLGLQRKMTGHYKKLNEFSRKKLKIAQEKMKTAQTRHPVKKGGKDISRFGILAQASLHASRNL